MPLYSEHIANMYYSGTPSYTGVPYSYSGSSYSAPYLNPGSSYSSHSSMGSYSRTPVSSRWITSSGRNYSPMLSTISERSSASPVRINSPRRIPIMKRSYAMSSYTPRPININTADIDVSKDKYRYKDNNPTVSLIVSPQRESPKVEKESSPYMPRVDGKPETGIDSSPGTKTSTIKRGRTVVRLHTLKRKERDSPRKPIETIESNIPNNNDSETSSVISDTNTENIESTSWREKLSEDLIYKGKKEKKSLGTKLVEKFILKDKNDDDVSPRQSHIQKMPENLSNKSAISDDILNRCQDRRCSMELLAEQADLLDSLIRSENLSTATLDLRKVGVDDEQKSSLETYQLIKRRKSNDRNPLQTTKSDNSLHDNLKSSRNQRDSKQLPKRRSLKKSSSGGSICRLDSITEFPKEPITIDLPAIEENRMSVKSENTDIKPKLKTKITSSVEVTAPTTPIKFRIDNVTVEEKPRNPKKEITYISSVENDIDVNIKSDEETKSKSTFSLPKKVCSVSKKDTDDSASPEPDDGNFWDKIGKRETVYLLKRKQNIEENKEKYRRALFWFPEEENCTDEEIKNVTSNVGETEQTISLLAVDVTQNATNEKKEIEMKNKDNIITDNLNQNKNKQIEIKNVDITVKNDITNTPKPINNKKEDSKISDCASDQTTHEKKKHESIIVKDKVVTITDSKIENIEKKCEANEDVLLRNNFKNDTAYDATTCRLITECTDKEMAAEAADLVLSKDIKTTNKLDNNHTSKDESLIVIDKSKIIDSTCMPENIIKQILGDIPSVENVIESKRSSQRKSPIKLISEKTSLCKKSPDKIIEAKHITEEQTLDTMKHPKITKEEIESELNITKSNVQSKVKQERDSESESKMAVIFNSNIQLANSLNPSDDTNIKSLSNRSKKNSKENKNKLPQENRDSMIKISKSISNNSNEFSEKTDSSYEDSHKVENKLQIDSTISKNKVLTETVKNIVMETINLQGIEKTQQFVKDPDICIKKDEDSVVKSVDSEKLLNVKPGDIPMQKNNDNHESLKSEEPIDGEGTKADVNNEKQEGESDIKQLSSKDVIKQNPAIKRPVKDEPALRPLIATPRPLQKKVPQVIHSSSSSETSSEGDSSDDDEADESDTSDDSTEFFECENNADGRTSTGSNDSGFDSSAPTSPAGFMQIKKDCDVNCHRKCEKLTANLCGVNQRLLVEALATRTASKRGGETAGTSSSSSSTPTHTLDVSEQELEQSTAYGIFRKTGRFTPPARSIPRFRKYNIEDFHFIKVLGKGSFGKVLLAELRDTEYYYAVKCLKKDVVLEDDDVECTLIERKVLALGTNHPYLCHLFATFQTDSHLFFVMEYLNGGDLMFHIQQSGRFPESRARFYAAEIVSGLKFLHKRGIVYRDLKLDNILLDFEGHVRIADFGMCKLQIYLEKTADTFCGTPDYMAPEIIKGLKYNQTVDWWSFGVLLYEMLIGQSPFSGCDEDELFWSICNEMPSYPRFLSQQALTILTRLLDKDSKSRLGGTECMHGDVRDQDFFNPIHWEKLERRELEAPFKPRVRHPLDTQYFDRAFTGERPRLTAVEPQVLRSMDQAPFRGFSYTNPNATDR